MSFDPLTAAFDLGKGLIDKFFPDPIAKAEEMRKLTELHQKGDLAGLNAQTALMMGQIKVNEASAKHPSLFVAGARPFIIWVCGVALGLNYIVPLIMGWVAYFQCDNVIEGTLVVMQCAMPERPDISEMLTLLGGMLGLGALRSYDKKGGNETVGINKRQGK